MAETMVSLTASISGRALLIVDDWVTAIVSELDADHRIGKSVFLLGRVFGITAGFFEENVRAQLPSAGQHKYDGPQFRPFLGVM